MNKEMKSHPSWGMIGINRCQGSSTQLFDSDVQSNQFMEITIKRAEKSRELGRDWVFGRERVISVRLSPVQFSELLTNLNVGDGVPCTINYTEKDGHIEFQPETPIIETIIEERNSNVEEIVKNQKSSIDTVKELLKDKKIPAGVGKDLLWQLEKTLSGLEGSGKEFYKEQAKKEILHMVDEAKRAVSEYVDNKIRSVGLETLVKQGDMPQLNGWNESEKPEEE